MIGFLRGMVLTVEDEYLLLDVNGVGYKVFANSKLLELARSKTDPLEMYIETVVKEDSISLFGFADKLEQEVFNQLIGVSGLGKKFAMRILSALEPVEIFMALEARNEHSFSAVNGIGAKLAERIVNDLKGNKVLKSLFAGINIAAAPDKVATKATHKQPAVNQSLMNNQKIFDATSALENLGYKHHEVFAVVKEIIATNPEMTIETLITESLKKLN